MHIYPKRASLEGLEIEIFKLVSYSATPEQWKEWLRVPLEHAAARGNLDLFNKLLGAGANGSAGWRGCRDRTLLDAAAVGGNEEIVSGLLGVGAQPDVKVVSCSSKRSSLYTATVLSHDAVARRLVVAGADVDFQDPVDKWSVLNEAAWGRHEQLVAYLLIGGADPNCRGRRYENSPLHDAAYQGFDGIVSTLLLRGAGIDALDRDGATPLIWASREGRLSVVKTLLAAGVDVSIRDIGNYSALECATIEGHGVDVNAGDDDGYTALHTAAECDQAGAIDALIKAGANVELKEGDGRTPLATAALNSRCKAIRALLQHGAKVDVPDGLGLTPLHSACHGRNEGLEAAADLLLRWGADETALDSDGDRPAALLDMEEEEDVDNPATQNEIERTRLLLTGAPADRAWHRRGWLVMLRSRYSKAKVGRCTSDDHGAGNEGGGFKVARSENIAGVGNDGPRNAGNGVNGELEAEGRGWVLGGAMRQLEAEMEGAMRTASGDGCVVAAEGGEEGLRLGVLTLLGLGLEGVYRTVVGFV